jgi:hypothetical protein
MGNPPPRKCLCKASPPQRLELPVRQKAHAFHVLMQITKETMNRTIDRNVHLLIALIPVAIYMISYSLFELNGETSLSIKSLIIDAVKSHPLTPSFGFIEYKSRMLWLSSSLLSLIAYGIALVWSAAVLSRCCRRSHFIPVFASGLAIMSLTVLQITGSNESSALYNNIFATTYQALEACTLIPGETLKKIYLVISIINLLAAVTPVFILMAIAGVIALPRQKEAIHEEFFKVRMDYLKQGIMIGSLVLLFGIIHMDTWMQWPLALIDDNDLKTAALAALTAVSQFWGVAFSLLLITFYAAAALYWRYRTCLFLTASKPDVDIRAWLDDNGFTFSWHKHALQLSTMLSPFLAGSFSAGMSLLALS